MSDRFFPGPIPARRSRRYPFYPSRNPRSQVLEIPLLSEPQSSLTGLAFSEYLGLRFTIHRILHGPGIIEIGIYENIYDPTVQVYRTRKSHNMRDPIGAQTLSELRSVNSYTLVRTKGLF
ncbi:hypothetical protein L3X38_011303 [Prunus dulcis]|uniref:Uncharacterized protein n=1 Tax=Prunus dulcis TaxID=3755 RepID=A0AAD4WJY0_PRUDU|nr:hypothetical protein L3X38_011303 [Prunus dulcis]